MSTFPLYLGVVVAVLCMSAGQAATEHDAHKRAAGSCQWRQFQVSSCVANGYVDFQILHDAAYKQSICRHIQPAYTCLVQHQSECPSIAIFQGQKGMTAANFLSAYRAACTGPAQSESCEEQRGGPAEGCDKLQFKQNLQNCHSPLQMALRDNQMCQPLEEVSGCVEGQVQKYQSCGWMTSCLTRQLHLAASYFRAIRVFHYSCQPNTLQAGV